MAGVKAGGDRQDLHERIRRHALAAAEQVKQHGRMNDLMERLQKDDAFRTVDLQRALDPSAYVGRAPEQTETFVESVIEPIRKRFAGLLGRQEELRV